MRKLFALIFMVILFGQAYAQTLPERGLFVSLIQNPTTLSSRTDMVQLVQFAKENNIRVLFVQIYRSGNVWFTQARADSPGNPLFDAAAKNVGEDPLSFLIRIAHANQIEVHAWLNLLTLNENSEAAILKKHGPDILTQKPGPEKKSIEEYKIDSQYFLEPGDLRVREELKILVENIAVSYPTLDGIQLDYIRYPDSQPFYGYTPNNIARFKAAKGDLPVEESNLEWKNWRRDQVTELVSILRESAHVINPKLQFTTTGCAPYIRALEEAFQDWPKWQNEKLADFVTVMTYPKTVAEFEKQIEGLKKRQVDFSKLNIAIGTYKLLKEPEIFKGQLEVCENSGARSCVFFHYGDFIESPALADVISR